ncbi:MAG: redoxin domain-containing protein [Phycisphaerales bacterium]|jgi:thiol-disulfide isomerase/thioredoxin
MKRSPLVLKAAGLVAFVMAGAALPANVMAQATDAAPAAKAKDEVLKVGSMAPRIKVDKWVKGDKIEKFDNDHAYVVEFWATWCPPCKKSIPHLGEMAEKYKDKNVKFIGVSVWEENQPAKEGETYLQRVDEFANKGPLSSKMTYNVAYDGDQGEMANTWMRASHSNGIPTAFVVDKTQHIVWIGHPLDKEFEGVVEKVVGGTYDTKAAADKATKAAEAEAKAKKIIPDLRAALQAEDGDKAMKSADELMALDNEQYAGAGVAVFNMMLNSGKDPAPAYAYGSKLAEGPLKDNAEALNALAWTIVDPEHPVTNPKVDVAVKIADRAVEVTKGQDAAILDTQARAYFVKGDTAKAITIQEKVVAMADADLKEQATKTLEEYKAKAGK